MCVCTHIHMCKHSKTWKAWSKWKPYVPTTQLQKQINQYLWSPLCVHSGLILSSCPRDDHYPWAHRSCELWVFHSDFPPLYSRWSWWVCQSENPTPVIKVSTYLSLQEWVWEWTCGLSQARCDVDMSKQRWGLCSKPSAHRWQHKPHGRLWSRNSGYRGKAWPRWE